MKCKITGNSCHLACCRGAVEEMDTVKSERGDIVDKGPDSLSLIGIRCRKCCLWLRLKFCCIPLSPQHGKS